MSSQQRAAYAYHLLLQRPHTTKELAQELNLSPSGVRRLLYRLSNVVPIYDYQSGKQILWDVCKKGIYSEIC